MEKPRTLMMMIMVSCLFLGFGNSDLAQDRAECTDQLVGLATCLPYVGGDAKVPTKDCCEGFKGVLDKSEKCICILIKDRDDPQLGLKINATLAVHLPVACHQTAPNITKCTSLLHLPPNSPAAKEFESLGKVEGNADSTSSPNPKGQKLEPPTSAETQIAFHLTKTVATSEPLLFCLSLSLWLRLIMPKQHRPPGKKTEGDAAKYMNRTQALQQSIRQGKARSSTWSVTVEV